MKRLMTGILVFAMAIMLNGCGEWDDLVDSVTGSDDDEPAATQSELPRKDVSKPATQPTTDTKKDTSDKDPKTDGYSKKETYTSYGVRNGGRQAWRIPKKGPAFGKKIKVVFSNGHTVYVNNTSKNYRESDGFVFKPGIGPNGEGSHDTGTAHGGVYLHAPYGNKSKQVTFYF